MKIYKAVLIDLGFSVKIFTTQLNMSMLGLFFLFKQSRAKSA